MNLDMLTVCHIAKTLFRAICEMPTSIIIFLNCMGSVINAQHIFPNEDGSYNDGYLFCI